MLKYDTLKTFNYLDGNIYTFKHNNLKKFIDKNKETYNQLLNKLITNKLVIKNLLKILYINSSDKIFDMLISSIDYLGEIFDIDDSKIYSINNYNKILLNKFNDNYYTNFSKFKLHELLESDKSIYYIYIKIEECIEKNNYDDLSKTIPLFPKQFISALYLYMLKIKDS